MSSSTQLPQSGSAGWGGGVMATAQWSMLPEASWGLSRSLESPGATHGHARDVTSSRKRVCYGSRGLVISPLSSLSPARLCKFGYDNFNNTWKAQILVHWGRGVSFDRNSNKIRWEWCKNHETNGSENVLQDFYWKWKKKERVILLFY